MARTLPHTFGDAEDLAEARFRSEGLTLDERLAESLAMHMLALREIARTASDANDLLAKLDRDPPGCPYDRYLELRARGAREPSR